MLRESMQTGGKQVDLSGVTQGFRGGVEVPHAADLVAFAEAVVQRDDEKIAPLREKLKGLLGADGIADAAATVAAFHGFVRIADAIGIPYAHASGGRDLPELREQAGVNGFYRVTQAGAPQ